MKYLKGDIFSFGDLNPDAICITTNCIVKKNGAVVMGAGIAKRAKQVLPNIDFMLAEQVKENGHIVQEIGFYTFKNNHTASILSFPTKFDWRKPSTTFLIERSLVQLVTMRNEAKWNTVLLPRPGCNNGGLDYETQVKPLLVKYLDDRFYIVTK